MSNDYAPTILAVSTLLGTIVSSYIALMSLRASRKNSDAIAEVKQQTDGLTEKLVTSEKAVSKAEGKVEERQEVAERVIVAQAAKEESQKIQLPPP